MDEDFRMTGKFRPLLEAHDATLTTDSLIQIPLRPHQTVQWCRKYGDTQESLSHLNNSPFYQCSQLDAECVIEAIVRGSEIGSAFANGTSESSIHTYGPIKSSEDWDGCCEDPACDFVVDIPIGNIKVCQCYLFLSATQIQLKPRNPTGSGQGSLSISFQQITSTYVEQLKSRSTRTVIVFPSILLRTACLKLLNEIVFKGSCYTENNDQLKMHLVEAIVPGNEHNGSINFQNYILHRLNKMKHDKDRRSSQISSFVSKKAPKPSILSTEAKKSYSGVGQDSEDSFRVTKKPVMKDDKFKLKNSQFITSANKGHRDSNMAVSESEHPASLQDEGNYFSQFQNLIYEKQEPENEVLVLNESFEALEKNSNTDEEIQKLKLIKQKKMQREFKDSSKVEKLKIKLIDLKIEKEELLKVNRKLQTDIKKIEEVKSQSQDQGAFQQAKAQLVLLKAEYNRLVESKQKKKEIPALQSYKSSSDLYARRQ